MQHDFHPVDILDKTGKIISQKPRNKVDKSVDIFHTAHVILITPRGEVVMSIIPLREDLPNVYANKLGTTVATIRRSNETILQAAKRSVSRELFIDEMPLTLLGEQFHSLPPMRDNLLTAYYGISEVPETYSLLDIDGLIVMAPREIDAKIEDDPDAFAGSFIAVWDTYRKKLPI